MGPTHAKEFKGDERVCPISYFCKTVYERHLQTTTYEQKRKKEAESTFPFPTRKMAAALLSGRC